jgi:hypothetical protein
MTATHEGQCFCGLVRFEAAGDPIGMGYCHCNSCRAWAAAPVTQFALWNPKNVRITQSAEHLTIFKKGNGAERLFCAKCGGHVMARDAHFTDVFASVLPTLRFIPEMHIHYAEAVLPMKDGLPKFADLPGDSGGSGKLLPE